MSQEKILLYKNGKINGINVDDLTNTILKSYAKILNTNDKFEIIIDDDKIILKGLKKQVIIPKGFEYNKIKEFIEKNKDKFINPILGSKKYVYRITKNITKLTIVSLNKSYTLSPEMRNEIIKTIKDLFDISPECYYQVDIGEDYIIVRHRNGKIYKHRSELIKQLRSKLVNYINKSTPTTDVVCLWHYNKRKCELKNYHKNITINLPEQLCNEINKIFTEPLQPHDHRLINICTGEFKFEKGGKVCTNYELAYKIRRYVEIYVKNFLKENNK